MKYREKKIWKHKQKKNDLQNNTRKSNMHVTAVLKEAERKTDKYLLKRWWKFFKIQWNSETIDPTSSVYSKQNKHYKKWRYVIIKLLRNKDKVKTNKKKEICNRIIHRPLIRHYVSQKTVECYLQSTDTHTHAHKL